MCPILCREENVVAIDLITQHIRMKLQQPDLRRIYHSLELIPSNYQIRGMHTILRDQKTNKTDFVFIADRLLRLVRLYRCKQQMSRTRCMRAVVAGSKLKQVEASWGPMRSRMPDRQQACALRKAHNTCLHTVC